MASRILDAFECLVATWPRRPAIISLSEDRSLSFEDLAAELRAVRDELDRAGLPERAVVLSNVGNRIPFVPIFLGCLQKNLVLAPLDGDTSPVEVKAVRERYGASALIRMAGGGNALRVEAYGAPRKECDVRNASILKLTSGSTGVPRAVCVTEEQIWNDGRHVIEAMGIESNDVNLGLIPVSHSYGLGNLVLPLLIQGTALVLRASFTPSLFRDDVERTGATVFPGVPFMFRHFRQQQLGALPLSLRLVLTAGARIDPDTVAYFKERLGRKIHSFYGTSETGGIAYDDSEDVSEPFAVGRPMPETTIGFDNERVLVRGSAVASGYTEDSPDPAAPRFVDGGFLTGDLGSFDAAGRLVLTGRVSTFVNVAGRKVSPEEIERVLLDMGAVREARVIGVPCEKRGQKLLACVVPQSESLSLLDVRHHCAQRLSPHKVPHEVVLVRELPVDSRGKLSLKALETLLFEAGMDVSYSGQNSQ